MGQLADVNTTDIVDAITLGCRCMSQVFNPDDADLPYFRAIVRPNPFLGISCPEHVPGRHLNALLKAQNAVDIDVDEVVIQNHARAAFYASGGPIPLPLARVEGQRNPTHFVPHHVREGFHALTALVQYRNSKRAQQLAAAAIEFVLSVYDFRTGWNYNQLERDFGIEVSREHSFVSGLARAIGPLVKYYRVSGYSRALELAIALADKVQRDAFDATGAYHPERFGTHTHSVTCVMSSLAQLADLTADAVLMDRVKNFYDNGLWKLRDPLGWSIESTAVDSGRPDEGEINNTGDILETALILGRAGYTQYYHDAERMLRCHLLPAQLRDVSFIEDPPNPQDADGLRKIADRLRGSFGFPAPFGHEPLENHRLRFNTDVVGGAVGSLCEAWLETTYRDASGHRVNMLFDRKTEDLHIESPYTHEALRIIVKRPAPLSVRLPPWVQDAVLRVDGCGDAWYRHKDCIFVPVPPVNRPLTFTFPMVPHDITLAHQTRDIRVRLRGDSVESMDNFGADLTFFPLLR